MLQMAMRKRRSPRGIRRNSLSVCYGLTESVAMLAGPRRSGHRHSEPKVGSGILAWTRCHED